jgi:uncharacterized protein involved in exopolysaccharide biosynthesis
MDSLVEPVSSAPPAPSPVLPPAQILAQFKRNAVPIGICFVLGAAGAYYYASTLPKSYTAGASVAVEGDRMAIPELQGALRADNAPDPMPLVHTEVQALESRDLVRGVVDQLQLVKDPEFNAALRPPTTFGKLRDWLKSFLPKIRGPEAPDGSDEALLNSVMHNLVISQDNRSLVIGVAFSSHDPVLAAKVVNTLVRNYIHGRAERRVSANLGANTAMSQRIEQVRTDIAHIEQQMRDLREKSESVALRAGSIGQQQVEDLTNAASQATLQRTEIEANWQRASALAAGGNSDALATVLGSATISRLREQETEASGKVASLSQRYGAAYPELRSAEADLAATKREIAGETRRIVDSLSTQLRVARAHEADVLAQLAAARRSGVTAQNTQAQLDQLQQDAATRRDLYRTLLERAQQTSSQPLGTETPDVRVLSNASPPGTPSAPNMKMAAGFGGMAGGLLASMGVLAFTRRTGGRPDAAAFARHVGGTVVATLRGRAARNGLADRVLTGEAGPEAQALNIARVRLGELSRVAPRVVCFVGAQPGEAATAVACAYARAAAREGRRVLLVDGDPGGEERIANILGTPPGRLADAYAGLADWRDCVVPDRVDGLDVLTGAPASGETPYQTVGLENLLVEARTEYAQVVLGAPEAQQAHAVSLVRSSDITVVVLDERSMRPQPAAVACARLRGLSRSPLAAVVLASA